MKVFLLSLISAVLLVLLTTPHPTQGAGALHNFLPTLLYPPGNMRDPSACRFNGPQDGPTLRGQNFLENYGTGSCLTFRRAQPNLPIDMGVCSWNSLPASNQLFNFNNGNGGTILKTTVSGSFGADTCVTTSKFGGSLTGERCSPSGKDFAQTWRFNKIRNNLYQVTQISSSKCLRVDSTRVGATPTVVRCNAFDNFQLWRICTSK